MPEVDFSAGETVPERDNSAEGPTQDSPQPEVDLTPTPAPVSDFHSNLDAALSKAEDAVNSLRDAVSEIYTHLSNAPTVEPVSPTEPVTENQTETPEPEPVSLSGGESPQGTEGSASEATGSDPAQPEGA